MSEPILQGVTDLAAKRMVLRNMRTFIDLQMSELKPEERAQRRRQALSTLDTITAIDEDLLRLDRSLKADHARQLRSGLNHSVRKAV